MAFGVPPNTPQYDFKGVQDCVDVLEYEGKQLEQNGCLGDRYILFSMDERSFLECVEGKMTFWENHGRPTTLPQTSY
jgi:hypothetical protein